MPYGVSCMPTANDELPGFGVVCLDRDNKLSGKKDGGGLALYISNRWCNSKRLYAVRMWSY